uniref:Uncharacterized protein n=1 Tax=Acrobeloides nanus TaxID=290746 RepID=A0A914CVD8_9BILA
MRVLKSIEICSLDFGDIRDDSVKHAVIESPKSNGKIWITSGASYIDAVRVFLSMNEYEMRTLFRSSSSTLRQIPDSVTHVELNFQQFYESSYTDEFVPFLIQNPLNNGDNYTITLRGFEDFARRISYVDFVDLCDQILRVYENSKTPKNMVQKIIL